MEAVLPQTYDLDWQQCYWRMHYFYHNVKEYYEPKWEANADYSKQSIMNAWVEAKNKADPTVRIRITCQNGKYIVLDTRVD
jgi:hypothetical protein